MVYCTAVAAGKKAAEANQRSGFLLTKTAPLVCLCGKNVSRAAATMLKA